MDFETEDRAATFTVVDRSVVFADVRRRFDDRIELLPIAEAVDHDPRAAAVAWSVLDPNHDEAVAEAHRAPTGGFYVRVPPGRHITMPIQACLLLSTSGSRQVLHNVIIVEEEAELSMITGCAAPAGVRHGTHIGVTEIVLGPGATFTDTMIHRWSPDGEVLPRSALVAGRDATHLGNYVLLEPPRHLQSESVVHLDGDRSRTETRSIVHGTGSANIDLSTEVHLKAAGTSADSVARAIARDRSDIALRAELVGHHDRTKGRLDCRGLLQSPDACITAVPELRADHAPRSQLAHEASIGPISEEAIEYLMTRGVERQEATAAITRGFLKAGLPRLPPLLERRIRELTMTVATGSL